MNEKWGNKLLRVMMFIDYRRNKFLFKEKNYFELEATENGETAYKLWLKAKHSLLLEFWWKRENLGSKNLAHDETFVDLSQGFRLFWKFQVPILVRLNPNYWKGSWKNLKIDKI